MILTVFKIDMYQVVKIVNLISHDTCNSLVKRNKLIKREKYVNYVPVVIKGDKAINLYIYLVVVAYCSV